MFWCFDWWTSLDYRTTPSGSCSGSLALVLSCYQHHPAGLLWSVWYAAPRVSLTHHKDWREIDGFAHRIGRGGCLWGRVREYVWVTGRNMQTEIFMLLRRSRFLGNDELRTWCLFAWWMPLCWPCFWMKMEGNGLWNACNYLCNHSWHNRFQRRLGFQHLQKSCAELKMIVQPPVTYTEGIPDR